MPYNEAFDSHIVSAISGRGTTRKKMCCGTCHPINGNRACGVYQVYLVLRIVEKQGSEALKEPYVRPFDATGKSMKGWAMVNETDSRGGNLTGGLKKPEHLPKAFRRDRCKSSRNPFSN